MQSDKYRIITEYVWNEDYQAEYYCASIVNICGERLWIGKAEFISEESAYADAEIVVAEFVKKDALEDHGIDFKEKVFVDPKEGGTFSLRGLLLIALMYILPTIIVGITLTNEMSDEGMLVSLGLSTLLFILPLVIVLSFQHYFYCNMMTYLWCDENLYRILEPQEDVETSGRVPSITMALLFGVREEEPKKMSLNDELYFEKIMKSNGCWRILSVKDIIKKGKVYKIPCRIEKGRRHKKRNKTIYMIEGYSNFDALMNCFLYRKAYPVEE